LPRSNRSRASAWHHEPRRAPGYNLAKTADVTVLLYKRTKVVANHAFKQGEPTGAAVDGVLAEVDKVAGK